MVKIKVDVDYNWVYGYLKYAHRKGILELEDEEFEDFKKILKNSFEKLICYMI